MALKIDKQMPTVESPVGEVYSKPLLTLGEKMGFFPWWCLATLWVYTQKHHITGIQRTAVRQSHASRAGSID